MYIEINFTFQTSSSGGGEITWPDAKESASVQTVSFSKAASVFDFSSPK